MEELLRDLEEKYGSYNSSFITLTISDMEEILSKTVKPLEEKIENLEFNEEHAIRVVSNIRNCGCACRCCFYNIYQIVDPVENGS